jgi:EAL domain-containing protein (putative c-di-GMP-specific phosphodiesterase class I)
MPPTTSRTPKHLCDAMSDLNIRCSIKHFGCSLDPFKTLAHLNVEMVKIDGSFANDIQHKNEKTDTLKELIQKLNETRKTSIVPYVEQASLDGHTVAVRRTLYSRQLCASAARKNGLCL